MKFVFAAALIALTASPGALPTKVSDLDGDWYNEEYKVALNAKGGVITLTECCGKMQVAPALRSPGLVVAELTGVAPVANKHMMPFSGQCLILGGEGWRLRPCGTTTVYVNEYQRGGKTLLQLSVSGYSGYFMKKADMARSTFNSRE